MEKVNKKGLILAVVGALLAIILIGLYAYLDFKPMIKESKESNEIVEKFNKTYNSKERSIIYYAKDNCAYCKKQTPILEELADEYDFDYLYINTNLLTSKDISKITNKLDIKNETPITIIVENGKVIDKQIGYVDGPTYTEFLKNNDILDDDAEYPGEKEINFVDFDEYQEIIKSAGTNVVVIGQTGCSHCTAIKPALNEVAKKYDLVINYLNITEFKSGEEEKFYQTLTDINYDDEDYLADGSFGTPLTLIIKDGKVIKYISGERTPSGLVREFKKVGLINE